MTQRLSTDQFQTLIAKLRLWLIGVAVWFAERTPFCDAREVDEELRFYRRGLAAVCLLLAMKRAVRPLPELRARRPFNTSPGCRRARRRLRLRLYTRMIASAQTLRGRYEALKQAAESTEALIARMVAVLESDLPPLAHVMVEAPRESATAQAAPRVALADSS